VHPHHERVIRHLVARFEGDPRYPALIIGGSIAKGRELPDSDVDILLVATDEEFARRLREVDVWYKDDQLADFPGGYTEGKVIDRQFLVDAADHGSEPARAAFKGAFIAYSRIPDLSDLIARIPVYPERERAEKIRAFYIQLDAASAWFMTDAEKSDDPYLRAWAATTAVFYGYRLILAHNRILYPWHKWLLHEVRQAQTSQPTSWAWRSGCCVSRAGRRPRRSGIASWGSATGACPRTRPWGTSSWTSSGTGVTGGHHCKTGEGRGGRWLSGRA